MIKGIYWKSTGFEVILLTYYNMFEEKEIIYYVWKQKWATQTIKVKTKRKKKKKKFDPINISNKSWWLTVLILFPFVFQFNCYICLEPFIPLTSKSKLN